MSLQRSVLWLKGASAIVIGFGILTVFGAWPSTAGPILFLLDFVIWPLDGAQSGAATELRLALAISGGIMAGWGILLWQLSTQLYPREPNLGRRLILTSIGVWFVIDSLGSIAAGVPLNALLNTGFLVLFYVALRKPKTTAMAV